MSSYMPCNRKPFSSYYVRLSMLRGCVLVCVFSIFLIVEEHRKSYPVLSLNSIYFYLGCCCSLDKKCDKNYDMILIMLTFYIKYSL